MSINAALISGLDRYVREGVRTGSFLYSVLCDRLTESVLRADAENLRALPEIVSFVFDNVPASARGDEERVEAWIAHRGAAGLDVVGDVPLKARP